MTQPPSLGSAAEAALAYETSLVSHIFLPYAERLVDAVAPTGQEDVVDLACGTGAVTRVLAARCGPSRITGVDITEAMLDVARSLLPDVTFRQGAFAALPLPDACADVVLCQQGLQFAPDRPAAAAEMARVLRPGGRIAIASWTDVADQPVFDAFRRGVLAMGWEDLAQGFTAPFSLPGAELRALFGPPAFDDVAVTEVTLELYIGDPREMARIYASFPPFSTRYLAASPADRKRYLDAATAGITDTQPFTASLLTAVRARG